MKRRRLPAWVGILPFLVVAFLFLIWPAYAVVLQAFQGADGGFTLDNLELMDFLQECGAAHAAEVVKLEHFDNE
jgi:ABC-type uncharacterized transport system permease subunit